MFDKYFGFLKLYDENSVIESFVNHTIIEKEKLKILTLLIDCVCDDMQKIEENYQKIREVHQESKEIKANISNQIIEANFDHQKQYDLLRLFQRIEKFSELIMATAKRIVILGRMKCCYPQELKKDLMELTKLVQNIHSAYIETLEKYQNEPKKTIKFINKVEDLENLIDHQRSQCLENLYLLGNKNKLPIGTLRIIEEIVEHLESVADSIEEAAKSIEWLLLA
ncbi:DUF47 family protein [Candidatus Margulisiibacteriota bacterium]